MILIKNKDDWILFGRVVSTVSAKSLRICAKKYKLVGF
jgi:hypothetical protein